MTPAGPFHVAIHEAPSGRLACARTYDDLVSAWRYADELRADVAAGAFPTDHVGVHDLDTGEWVTDDDYLDMVCEPGEQQGAAAE